MNQRRQPELRQLSPIALADLMLLEVVARGRGSIVLEPAEGAYQLVFDGGGEARCLGTVDPQCAEATLARLALIAGVGLEPPRVSRIPLRLASHRGASDAAPQSVLLSLRATRDGLGAELHALASASPVDHASEVAGIEGAPASGRGQAKYEVLGELGRGGMGIVFLARHVKLDKEVALKVLAPAMAQRRALAAQFVVEARAACRARHPAIVDVTDFGRLSDGRDYLVMERILWPTLARLSATTSLPPHRSLSILIDLAAGLGAAHRHGVVHRDLKPANVFVSPDDRVKIGDFGLAASVEGAEAAAPLGDALFGTAAYMAPEHIAGGTIDHRVDLYAFGCILHELATGAPPYAGPSSAEIMRQHELEPIPVLADVPAELAALHRRLLAKAPADRPASFVEVAAELAACREVWR